VRAKKKIPLKKELAKTAGGIFVLAILVIAAGYSVKQYLSREQPVPVAMTGKAVVRRPVPVKKARVKKAPVTKGTPSQAPQFEIFPEKEIPHHKVTVPPQTPVSNQLPRVAIIIDDLGYNPSIVDKFLDLGAVLTFSVLPYSPYQNKIAGKVKDRGFELMLHLPMEPREFPRIDPGRGALLTAMTPDELIRRLITDLRTIPDIKGVNNHMGSRLTAEADRMNQVFSVLKKRGLYFIDSRTTSDTRSDQSARLFKLPFGQRDVFLDHIQEPQHIEKQIRKLIRYAEIHGEAIGIGHPHSVTYRTLRKLLPELKSKVVLVPASGVVHVAG